MKNARTPMCTNLDFIIIIVENYFIFFNDVDDDGTETVSAAHEKKNELYQLFSEY